MIPIIMSENGSKDYYRTFGIILFYEQEKIGITYLYNNVKVYK